MTLASLVRGFGSCHDLESVLRIYSLRSKLFVVLTFVDTFPLLYTYRHKYISRCIIKVLYLEMPE